VPRLLLSFDYMTAVISRSLTRISVLQDSVTEANEAALSDLGSVSDSHHIGLTGVAHAIAKLSASAHKYLQFVDTELTSADVPCTVMAVTNVAFWRRKGRRQQLL